MLKSETRLLTHLYWKQTEAVRCADDISEWLDIKQGVRQGCVASPHLFALYKQIKSALHGISEHCTLMLTK